MSKSQEKRESQGYDGAWKIENAEVEIQSQNKRLFVEVWKVNEFWFISDLFEVLEKTTINIENIINSTFKRIYTSSNVL